LLSLSTFHAQQVVSTKKYVTFFVYCNLLCLKSGDSTLIDCLLSSEVLWIVIQVFIHDFLRNYQRLLFFTLLIGRGNLQYRIFFWVKDWIKNDFFELVVGKEEQLTSMRNNSLKFRITWCFGLKGTKKHLSDLLQR